LRVYGLGLKVGGMDPGLRFECLGLRVGDLDLGLREEESILMKVDGAPD
jgi:hypothetical protein